MSDCSTEAMKPKARLKPRRFRVTHRVGFDVFPTGRHRTLKIGDELVLLQEETFSPSCFLQNIYIFKAPDGDRCAFTHMFVTHFMKEVMQR